MKKQKNRCAFKPTKMFSKILTGISILFAYTVHMLSFFIPRDNNLWIFIGWHYTASKELFADNAKYMFLHASQECPTITAVWMTRDRDLATRLRSEGYRAFSITSLRGIFYSLRAGYTFVDAFMRLAHWRYAGSSKVIQLWHGKGMKKTGHDSPYSLQAYSKYLQPNLFTKFHKLIASSDHTAKLMASTFRLPQSKVLITGLPRNDVFFREIPGSQIDENKKLADAIENARGSGAQKVILYAPTFRPDGSNPLDTLDLSALNTFLKERSYHFIITLHPKFSSRTIHIDPALECIHYVPAGFDSYPQLKHIDTLVTDYSSIYIDFLLLNRPIIFYTYDIGTYKSEMGLHEDFDTLTPGPHPKDFSELLAALDSANNTQVARTNIQKVLFSHTDGTAAKRIADAVLENSQLVGCGMLLVTPNKKMLLLKRGETAPHCPNQWGGPGGIQEEGETEMEAACRETAEECGITPRLPVDTKPFYTGVWKEDGRKVRYFLDLFSDEVEVTFPDGEATAYKWVTYEEARELKLSFCYHEAIEKLRTEDYL